MYSSRARDHDGSGGVKPLILSMRVNRKYGKQMKTRCGRSEACVLSKQAMRDAFIFVASMLLLLQQMVQGQTTEGGFLF